MSFIGIIANSKNFEGIKQYLENHYIEGIVFYRGNGEMCKIKRSDFGFEWNRNKNVKNHGIIKN